jgi:hypothetical protein
LLGVVKVLKALQALQALQALYEQSPLRFQRLQRL